MYYIDGMQFVRGKEGKFSGLLDCLSFEVLLLSSHVCGLSSSSLQTCENVLPLKFDLV